MAYASGSQGGGHAPSPLHHPATGSTNMAVEIIDWFFERDHSISPDGLLLSSPERGRTSAVADWPYEREGWSLGRRADMPLDTAEGQGQFILHVQIMTKRLAPTS